MKTRIGLIVVLGLLSSFWILVTGVYAYHVDAFTFFVPYATEDLDNQFDAAHTVNFLNDDIVTTISISVQRDGTTIYYDHWEDGLEPNITSPVQASTEVLNGNAGDVISLQNTVVVPRVSANIFYDGGDKIVSAGGTIAVTMAAWPESAGSVFAGAWELYPASRWSTSYIIPVGENLSRPGGGFDEVNLNIQAIDDNTTVQIDLDANGSFETVVTLDEGEQFNSINSPVTCNAGAQVQASAPVQVHVFTGDPSQTASQGYEARAYTIIPFNQWTNDYIAPRSSDGDYWLYNPGPTDPLTITAQTTAGSTPVTVPAGSTISYSPGFATGVRFTAANIFYGVAALDIRPPYYSDRDWGYALLPSSNLATQALIGWAPGNVNSPPDGNQSRVYVTAAAATTIRVDYNNDGTPDASYPISTPLDEVFIIDPDFDLTGARLYTENGVPFIAVWGQDESAPAVDPSIDVGTVIVPLIAPAIQKDYTLVEEGYDCGTVTRGYTLRFRLNAYNDSINPIANAIISDTLASGIEYVLASTTVDGAPFSDNSSGSPFPLDEGGADIGTIPTLGVIPVTYDVTIQNTGEFRNEVEFVSPSDAAPAGLEGMLPLKAVGYEVAMTLVDPSSGQANAGEVITFEMSITNTGSVTITQLPVRHEFDANYLTFESASQTPTSVDPVTGVVSWANLGTPLSPTASANVLVSFTVNDIPAGVNNTLNLVFAEGVEDSQGRTQSILCSEAGVSFAASQPEPEPEPPPSDDDDDDDDSAPPPAPPAAPPAAPAPAPTPAVLFLPETGVGRSPMTVSEWLVMGIPIAGALALWVVGRSRKR